MKTGWFRRQWLALKAKPWFALVLAVLGFFLTMLLLGLVDDRKTTTTKRGGKPRQRTFSEQAKAEAAAATKELEIRAAVERGVSAERASQAQKALEIKDPEERRVRLARLMTEWGS